ncbi:hypothetical protein MP228_003900 [Amoeboaphelidium protococcarum]|nr:hypothetical protein MP228_003900 [Amoeboaphelidium protococcarum]
MNAILYVVLVLSIIQFSLVSPQSLQQLAVSSNVTDIALDSQGAKWMCGSKNGLFHIAKGRPEYKEISLDLSFGIERGNLLEALSIHHASGDVYTVGRCVNQFISNQTIIGGIDIALFKLNATGVIQWSRVFGSKADDFAMDIQVDADNEFLYIVGSTYGRLNSPSQQDNSSTWTSSQCFTSKYSTKGSHVWTVQRPQQNGCELRSLLLDSRQNGYIYAGGISNDMNAYFVKINMVDGTLVKELQYKSSFIGRAGINSMVFSQDGSSIYSAGYIQQQEESSSGPKSDMWITQLDLEGTWMQDKNFIYGSTQDDALESVTYDRYTGLLVATGWAAGQVGTLPYGSGKVGVIVRVNPQAMRWTYIASFFTAPSSGEFDDMGLGIVIDQFGFVNVAAFHLGAGYVVVDSDSTHSSTLYGTSTMMRASTPYGTSTMTHLESTNSPGMFNSLTASTFNSLIYGSSTMNCSAQVSSSSVGDALSKSSPETTEVPVAQPSSIVESSTLLITQSSQWQQYASFSVQTFTQSSFKVSSVSSQLPPGILQQTDGLLQSWLVIMLLSILGLVLILAGIVLFYVIYKRRRQQRNLIKLMPPSQKNLIEMNTITSDISAKKSVYSTTFSQTNGHTMEVQTQHAMYIPGFLKFELATDVQLLQMVAKGGTSKLYRTRILNSDIVERSQDHDVILKLWNRTLTSLSSLEVQSFYQELSLLWRFRDAAFICHVFGYDDTQRPAMLLQYYPLGTLAQYIYKESPTSQMYKLTKRCLMRITLFLSQTIEFIHDQQVIHCDLKPQNVLLDVDRDGQLVPILSDFGIAQIADSDSPKISGFKFSELKGLSINYASPEVLHNYRQNVVERNALILKAGDVYSFSLIICTVLKRQRPWASRR